MTGSPQSPGILRIGSLVGSGEVRDSGGDGFSETEALMEDRCFFLPE